ncbi:MAG: DivIVA domain-containing protein [Clostridia bacterium]|nr:DivIVA domain-containing protein [Clostridia bacterium]
MLTPVDIENKEFTKAFRGYDIYEVEEFMKDLITDYEKLYRDNAELKEKNAVLSETISSYKGMEETMQNAILVAQRTAEDIKQNAYERSETIIKEAERKAAEAVNNANRSISNLEKTYLNMQREMNGFKAKMNSLLSTYMQLLSDLPEKSATLFASMNIPELCEDPAPAAQQDSTAMEDTNRFTLPSLALEKEAAPEPVSEKIPVSGPGEAEPEFAPIHKVNTLVEELMQKNKEQASAATSEVKSEPFSFVKETVEKESAPEISSVNLDELENFDVFSDDSL